MKGSLINHSEHRISSKEIQKLVLKLKELKMISIVCVKDVAEARKYAKLNPDYIAIEIGRAHVWTPVTQWSRMPSSAWKKKKKN